MKDQLTGLHNRRYMDSQLETLMAQATAPGGESSALLILDIDHFKRINDTYGHDVGDEVLREFAQRLAANVRAVDLPVRQGGEEFVVLMPNTGLADAAHIAERVRENVAGAPFSAKGGTEQLNVTISIGAAVTLGPGDTAQALIKRADEALYEAKSSGRNRVIGRAA